MMKRGVPRLQVLLWMTLLSGLHTLAAAEPSYDTRTLQGWTLHIQKSLWQSDQTHTQKALELLDRQLSEIVRLLPTNAVSQLQKVHLYFSPEYPGIGPRAEYHPDAGWLRANQRDPAMAQGIEFTNLRIFEREMDRMPNFALHELAHAYHHRFLPGGFHNTLIKTAYEKAKTAGRYDQVQRYHAQGRPLTVEKAYAMTNPQEYFAETTEAFFVRNDFFPFTRNELEKHDPEMKVLLARLWGVNP